MYMTAIILFIAITASTPAPVAPPRTAQPPTVGTAPATTSLAIERSVTAAKDIVNIAFFGIVAVVTVLTYRKAARTILQPIRTEVFKHQLELFGRMLTLFVGKSEHDLRRDIALNRVISANAFFIVDAYARTTFGSESDVSKRPYREDECPTARIKVGPETAEIFTDENGMVTINEKEKPWSDFKLMLMKIPRQHSTSIKDLLQLLESPLVPPKLIGLLQEYLDGIEFNMAAIEHALEEFARQLPTRYPTAESLRGQELTAVVTNNFNRNSRALKPIADRITSFIRDYCQIEHLLET